MRTLPLYIALFFCGVFVSCMTDSRTPDGDKEKATTQTVVDETVQQSSSKVKNVDVAQAKQLLEDSNVQLLDVRTPEETATGTIENAVTINWFEPDFKQKIASFDPSKPILVYCKSGGRSSKAAAFLEKKGFSQVFNLTGGYNAWKSGHH